MNTRKAAFAGSWYPADASDCEHEITRFLSQGPQPEGDSQSWMGGIVPHAGWYYSGQIACTVIHWLKDDAPPDLVVLFGMHLHSRSANHMMAAGAWETPFGELPVAGELADHLKERYPFQLETPQRFSQDNTIELQLPFVKYLLNPVRILALGVPPNSASLEIGKTIAAWAKVKGLRLKIIGSTDLTHYGRNYGFSPQGSGEAAVHWVCNENDRRIVDALLDMAPERVIDEALSRQNACCSGAAATAVAAVRQMGAKQSKKLAYATSYEKSPGDSFVGYVGVVFG